MASLRRTRSRPTAEPELQLAKASIVSMAALTAASSRVTAEDARRMRSISLFGWQMEALGYGESLGEVWYASKFYERSLRALTLKVQRQNPDTAEWEDTDDPNAVQILNGLVDANGEQSSILGMYGRQVFLTGEARLFGQIDPDTASAVWEMLSVEEVHVNEQGQYVRKASPIDQPEMIDSAPDDVFQPTGDGAVMFRLWTPSPRFSSVADSPMRAVLTICNELLMLTRLVRGEIISRLAQNGILYVPAEMILPVQNGARPDEDATADTMFRLMQEAMMTGIQDETSAASQIPLVVRGPAIYADSLKHIKFDKDFSQNENKRQECIHRLALSLDMPPEALEGVGDTNHWGAWQIDESAWKVHIEPVAKTLVENLTSSWFRPQTQDPMLRIWYDESALVNHPDRSTDFKDGFDRRVVSAAAYAREIGATEKDLMTPEEQDRFAELAALAHRGSDATATPSATADSAAPAAGTSETPAPGQASGAPAGQPAATTSAGTKVGPPATSTSTPVGGLTASAGVSFDRIAAAAESAVWRCREIAGSRLRSKVDRPTFATVTNCDLVHAVFDSDTGAQQTIDADALVSGGGALFGRVLETWNVPAELAAQIVTASEAHARDTLLDPTPGQLPDDLVALCTLGALGADQPQ